MGDGKWECSVCTYKNKSEAFKCEICDTRKGTSTRKPRVTATMVAQQIISSFPPIPPMPPSNKYQKSNSGGKRLRKSMQSASKLKNIDRETGRDIQVTVNGITITITDYKLSPHAMESETPERESSPIEPSTGGASSQSTETE
ncbi:YY1-associated factor 2-like [Clytia hemisphaerica]|uniref:RanBP2-type domain-containing protein n=1 Tax=Clytia hemisphaerica TaxID=252671 RepID=A0A7M5X3C6_9CNID